MEMSSEVIFKTFRTILANFVSKNQNLHKFKPLTKGAHIICLSRNSLITVFEAKKSLRMALGTYMLCLSSCHIDIWPIFVIFFSKSAYQIIFLPILMICEFIIGTLCWWWGPHKLAMFFLWTTAEGWICHFFLQTFHVQSVVGPKKVLTFRDGHFSKIGGHPSLLELQAISAELRTSCLWKLFVVVSY